MGRSLYLMLVALVTSGVVQLSDAACGTKTSCISDENCKAEEACLGEEGHMFCRRCLCDKKSQCVLKENNVECICDGFALKGPRCDCEVSTNDFSDCTDYSDDFLTINRFKIKNVQSATSAVNDYFSCENKCISEKDCIAFSQRENPVWNEETSRFINLECNLYHKPNDTNLLINNVFTSTSDSDIVSFRKCKMQF